MPKWIILFQGQPPNADVNDNLQVEVSIEYPYGRLDTVFQPDITLELQSSNASMNGTPLPFLSGTTTVKVKNECGGIF